MTIAQLKRIITSMDDSKEVFIFDPNNSIVLDIVSASNNNGNLQLNAENFNTLIFDEEN